MSDHEIEKLLFERLSANLELASRGYSVELNERGDLVIDRAGHVKGVWRSQFGVLEWTPAGYNGPIYRVANIDAAERHTLIALGFAD